MADHSIINSGPESTLYDKQRHESMRLRSNGMYGIPKLFLNSKRMQCCEKCVFGSGEHAEFCKQK